MDTTHIAQAASQLGRVQAAPLKVVTAVQDRQEVTAPTKPVFGAPAAKDKEATVDEQTTTAAVVKLNDYMQQEQRSLQFSVDDASGRTVVTITDTETKEIIRQIPPAQVLELMRSFAETPSETEHRGLLVRETV
jgi:flagellar protein FlaG